jgi:hypothetical protein
VEMPAPLASIDISRGHASFDRGSLGRAPCSGANACFSESFGSIGGHPRATKTAAPRGRSRSGTSPRRAYRMDCLYGRHAEITAIRLESSLRRD